METTIIKTSAMADIPALERELGGKFLSAQILGELAIVSLLPVASLEFFIDVRNCRGTLVLVDEKGKEAWITEEEWEYNPDLYQQLIDRVVYDDNDGAINLSGRYYPQSSKSLELFQALVQTLKKKEG